MNEAHITKKELRDLIERDSDALNQRVLLHLLAACPACYKVGGYILDLYRAGALPDEFSSLDVDLAKSRTDAPALLEKLRRVSFEHQKDILQTSRRYRSWGLAELLCERSCELAEEEPYEAIEQVAGSLRISPTYPQPSRGSPGLISERPLVPISRSLLRLHKLAADMSVTCQ